MHALSTLEWFVTIIGAGAAVAAVFGLRRTAPRKQRNVPQTFQEAVITLGDGFAPAAIVLSRGLEAKLRFRRDDGSREPVHVSIPAMSVERTLPPFTTTTVDVSADAEGVYEITSSSGYRGVLVILAESR
ncbi:MAG: cupredoxin domain-containing protein [Acidobacteriota bacterium]